jgi:glutaredoxin
MKKWLLFIPLLVLVQNWDRISEALIRPEPITGVGPGEVVLYATSWCGYCERTRKFLRAREVPFVEHDIERSETARQAYEALGGQGVPLLLIRGKVVRGYSPDAFLAALGQ